MPKKIEIPYDNTPAELPEVMPHTPTDKELGFRVESNLGRVMAAYQLQNGITIRAFADAIGINHSSAFRLINHNIIPDGPNLLAIIRWLTHTTVVPVDPPKPVTRKGSRNE